VLGTALVLSYSRAAVLLFFAGALAWVIALGFISRSPKGPAACASLLVVAASAFLIFGGATLHRLQSSDAVTLGFRKAIYTE